jgi:hypothetical protein
MTISGYLIQNIIRAYNKNLHLERINTGMENREPNEVDDIVQISLEGRKKLLFQKITQDVKGHIISEERKARDEDT